MGGNPGKYPRRHRTRNRSTMTTGQGAANEVDGGQSTAANSSHREVHFRWSGNYYCSRPQSLRHFPRDPLDLRQPFVIGQLLAPRFLSRHGIAHCHSTATHRSASENKRHGKLETAPERAWNSRGRLRRVATRRTARQRKPTARATPKPLQSPVGALVAFYHSSATMRSRKPGSERSRE